MKHVGLHRQPRFAIGLSEWVRWASWGRVQNACKVIPEFKISSRP
jgi:hypothetical protein